MKIYLRTIFCDEAIKILSENIEINELDLDEIKNHIINCEFCSTNLKLNLKQFSSPIAIMNLMNSFK